MKLINTAIILCLLTATAPAADFERLAYGQRDLEVDLGVGLWAWPMPVDYDEDGDLDLLVSCPDKPYNGTYFFENTSSPSSLYKVSFGLLGSKVCKMPLFNSGKRLGKGYHRIAPSYVDGDVRILINGREFTNFKKGDFKNSTVIKGIKSNVHKNKVRGMSGVM
jgi:hypothetical protein